MAIGLKKAGFAQSIQGYDQNPEHEEKALQLGICDVIPGKQKTIQSSDLLILAIPIDQTLIELPDILDHLVPLLLSWT